jgi:hypothetical protein
MFITNLSYCSRGQTTKVSCNGKGEKEKAERSYVEISRCSSVDLTGSFKPKMFLSPFSPEIFSQKCPTINLQSFP